MKLYVTLALCASWSLCAAAATNGYRWDPSATSSSTAAASNQPTTSSTKLPPPPAAPWFDWTRLVSSGPIHDLLTRAGVNVTQHLDAARQRADEKPWDTRVPMITDENWDDMVVNESLSPEEEKDRTWFMIVTMSAAGDPLSKYVDKEFDGAYNISIINQDLPSVRFGRIDYLTVTRLTTRWLIWKAPVLVVAHDRGKVLRFFKHNEIRLSAENLHKFLSQGAWTEVPAWDGPFAPGGDLEAYVEIFANWQEKIYNIVSRIPKWAFLVASGTIGSLIIQLMHSWGGGKKQAQQKQKRYVVKPASAVPPPAAAKEQTPAPGPVSSTPVSPARTGSPAGKRKRGGKK